MKNLNNKFLQYLNYRFLKFDSKYLGYISRDASWRVLAKLRKEFPDDLLLKIGIISRSKKKGTLYLSHAVTDRLLIFEKLAIIGRSIEDNCPKKDRYRKLGYPGLLRAKPEVVKDPRLFVYEGQFDAVLSSQRYGFDSVSLPSASANDRYFKILARYARITGRKVFFCRDNDDAGEKAGQRMKEIFKSLGVGDRLGIRPPSQGKDLTEYIRLSTIKS